MITVDSLIMNVPSLGSYAGVLTELEEVLGNLNSTLVDVGAVIEQDTALAANLLRLGNSSFFGFANRVETVFETIGLIGVQQVRDLISASVVIRMFSGVPEDQVNMESFWRHSLACGVAGRVLAIARRLPKPDKFFTAGLLHDIGRLVLFSCEPVKTREIFAICNSRRMLLPEAERRVLNFDHADIGAALLGAWNHPLNLINAVRFHHTPMLAGAFQIDACVIHLADHLVNAMELGSAGERFIPRLDLNAWERLNLPVDSLETVVQSVDEQVQVVEQVFLGSTDPLPHNEPSAQLHLS